MSSIVVCVCMWGVSFYTGCRNGKSGLGPRGGNKLVCLGSQAWVGSAGPGLAQLGSVRLGPAWLSLAQLGSAWPGSARPGLARLGAVRLGLARPLLARLGSAQKPSWLSPPVVST